MDAETIIKDEAIKFSDVLGEYEHEYGGALKFKNDLTTALYDYYEGID